MEEKVVPIIFCFNWSFLFVNYFLKIPLDFADIVFDEIFVGDGVCAWVRGSFVDGPFCDVCEVFNSLSGALYDWLS